MSKKIHRNSICPMCNSGLKYKKCCGKNEPLTATNMRYIGEEKTNATIFEKTVFQTLGHYPDDYISPIRSIGEVVYVLIDESNIGNHYAVSGVVVLKSELDRNINISSKLRDLIERYNIDYIHFTDIFGRKKILGDKRKSFVEEYINVIKDLNLKPFSVCMSESELKSYLSVDIITTEKCYMALTWILMFNILIYLTYEYGPELIIEMWRENENITNDKRILHQLNIKGVLEKFPFAHISIYRHYILFMKEELLFSSLSDLVAYLTIGVFPKIKSSYSPKELANNYYDLLRIFNQIFDDTMGMKNDGFDQLLSIVNEREQYRKVDV